MEKSVDENKPFFTTIWFHTPHLPVVSDREGRSNYKALNLEKQLYYGTLTAMDQQIGRLWKKLLELEIDEETIIFYCSDNGPEDDTPGSTGGFRGRKRSLYEGGVRVPAFVIWKNKFEKGNRISFPAVTSDYLPTILDILDINYPDQRPIDGISILSALYGKEKVRTCQYCTNVEAFAGRNRKAKRKTELPGQLRSNDQMYESASVLGPV